MAASKEDAKIVTTNSTDSELNPTTTTKEKYIQRLIKFLVFLGYQGTKEEKARAFADRARADPVHAFNSVLRFFQSKREQIVRKEMAIGTVRNYLKSTSCSVT